MGKWTCIKIDPTKLTGGCASVVYEAPAAVGAIEAVDYTNSNSADEAQQEQQQQPQFPHIYGGICADSVLQRFPIVRSNDGSFLEITGLC